jgi:hypothetical protein
MCLKIIKGNESSLVLRIQKALENPVKLQLHKNVCMIHLKYILHTGCNSDIWKKFQVNIYCIYIGTTETNDISAESP